MPMSGELVFCGISRPFAQGALSDWSIYSRILTLAAALCLITLIVLAIPALFDYWRVWRRERQGHEEASNLDSGGHDDLVSRTIDTATASEDSASTSSDLGPAGVHADGTAEEAKTLMTISGRP